MQSVPTILHTTCPIMESSLSCFPTNLLLSLFAPYTTITAYYVGSFFPSFLSSPFPPFFHAEHVLNGCQYCSHADETTAPMIKANPFPPAITTATFPLGHWSLYGKTCISCSTFLNALTNICLVRANCFLILKISVSFREPLASNPLFFPMNNYLDPLSL